MMTSSLENYLRVIYSLHIEKDIIRVTDIADELKVQKSSVTNALNSLKELEVIEYEKYKNIELSNKGLSMAKHIYKTHNIFKRFLTEVLEVDERLAEGEAEELSHCVSCHTTAKLEAFIEKVLIDK